MKKIIFCISLALTGLMTACVEKNEAVDAESKPDWLGESIYQELTNPSNMTGTFSEYLRLVNDLGYSEILNRTGSKTVFPANDDAFKEFYSNNSWGVQNYDQLSVAQKKMLLNSSMLDNALLVSMFSNVSKSSTEVTKGMAMKHQTNLNLIDTIECITSADKMPQNNKYWDPYRKDGNIYVVSDATRQMMVHFTREHMLNNGILTTGANSDFAILTGTPYTDGMAYIFDDQIIKSDITCQNGYVHQMKNVIVPPGNMAQVLRGDKETSYFSRIIDYYCAPYPNQNVTNTYNAWAAEQRKVGKDVQDIPMIYEVRYLNKQSAHRQNTDPDGNIVNSNELLNYDPGWNQYSPNQSSGGVDLTIADIGAMFVPTDEAMVKFFTKGGSGAYLLDLYGNYTGEENNVAHLNENLDSLRSKKPEILTKFVNNLMSLSFIETVPSKFKTILSDASEYKGISLDTLHKRADGRYDIKIANNGVIYKLDYMLAPDEYRSVMAPSSVYPDMQVMNWAVQDDEKLGVSFHYYLMAMKAKYAFFIPDDEAFAQYYVDPIYLGHNEPRVLKFSYDATTPSNPIKCVAYRYYPETGEVGDVMNNGANVPIAQWKSLMIDILNYHTVVLEGGEELGQNNYYKTKHGGEIKVTGATEGSKVMSGQQIDNNVAPSVIEVVHGQDNGKAFRIDHVIQAPCNSVSFTLQNDERFSSFYRLCAGFSNSELLEWAGISSTPVQEGLPSPQDAYVIFTTDNPHAAESKPTQNCLDENVKMFNTYNYTLYAPNNSAMEKAYSAGLPDWDDIQALKEKADNEEIEGEELEILKSEALEKIDVLKDFARYHFQSVSVYADNEVESGKYNSLSTDELGLALELRVSGGSGKLNVTDGAGVTHTIDANDSSKKSNMMTRDYWFNAERTRASEIYTSSFCVVHEISEPLNSGKLGMSWASRAARKSAKKK